MKLSERLYTLRKARGLTQEELAEALGVSRQAVSKWESGAAMPDTEKLISLSKYFGVTIDSLISGDTTEENGKINAENAKTPNPVSLFGIILCIIGTVLLIAWSITVIMGGELSGAVRDSSVIALDGRAILLLLCLASLILGAVLLFKNRK